MQELVSVIIPVYNRQDTISRAVESVLQQTYKNIEIIVVDDGSTDGTITILKSYSDPRIRILFQDHKGACVARNSGINEAKGFYIAFQDSDDEWMPDKLWKQIAYMKDNQFPICYCPFELHDSCISMFPPDYLLRDKYERDIITVLKNESVISTQTLILEKSILDDVGKFDSEMPRFQDYELIIRIVQKYKIGYCAEILVKVYRQKICITHDDSAKREAIYQLLRKHKDFFDRSGLLKLIILSIEFFGIEYIDINYLMKVQEVSGLSASEFWKVVIEFLHEKFFPLIALQKQQYDKFERELQTEQFAIYGAGTYAKKILNILLAKNLKPKCFLISGTLETKQYIQGIPVENPQREYRDMPILIGVNLKIQAEIIEYLNERGFSNFCVYPVYELVSANS